MTSFIEQIRSWRRTISDIEHIYNAVAQTTSNPAMIDLALPFMYRYAPQAISKDLDPKVMDLFGGYLIGRYPALREVLLTKEKQESIKNTTQTLQELIEQYEQQTETKEAA